MKLKIQNRINIIPITLYIIWCLYVVYFYLFRMGSFANKAPCGAGYLMIGLPIFTIIFTILTLLIITILNKIYKKKYYNHFGYIIIPCLILINIVLINIFL